MIKSITGHTTDAMLEHYQHLGADLAADLADRIGANGNGAVKALPPATGTDTPATVPASVLDGIRSLAEGLNARTWKANKSAILAAIEAAKES